MEACANKSVITYFNENWDPIRHEWVCGLVSRYRNFGERTTNRVESFFGKLKQLASVRASMIDYIRNVLTTLETFREEKLYQNIRRQTTVPTKVQTVPIIAESYRSALTENAFNVILPQIIDVPNVKVLDHETVRASMGILKPTTSKYFCWFFLKYGLPCKHMLALAVYNSTPTFLESAIAERWTRQYNSQPIYVPSTPTQTSCLSHTQGITERLTQKEKFQRARTLLLKAATAMSLVGRSEFNRRMALAEQFVNAVTSGQEFVLVMGISANTNGNYNFVILILFI